MEIKKFRFFDNKSVKNKKPFVKAAREKKSISGNSAGGGEKLGRYTHTTIQGPLLHEGAHGAGLKKGLCAQAGLLHAQQWVISYAIKHSAVGNNAYSRVGPNTRNNNHPPFSTPTMAEI